MDIDMLKDKFNYLCSKQFKIRIDLDSSLEESIKPKEEVLIWLENVERVKNEVKDHGFFFQEDLFKVVDELVEIGDFSSGLFANVVEQCANRSQLLDLIWNYVVDPNVRITSIVGMGGVGKTTSMMKIRNQLAPSDIFDTIIWVTVSNELSLHKVQTEIALQMDFDLPVYKDVEHRAARLHEKLLTIRIFLIIFDDLWGEIPLEKVGIPQFVGKVVLISRSWEICRNMKSDKIIVVEVLCGEEAWDLFVSKAGNMVFTPEIQPFARQVVQRCFGLPIIIISVGLAMRGKVGLEAWTKVLEELTNLQKESLLNSEDPLMLGDRIVLELLRFSYNRLRNDKVQKCFLYCAFFPEDYLFKPEELIRYWMAENFIHESGDIVKEIDDGYEIVRELEEANMLEIFTSGDDWLKMHDLFRELGIKIIKEEHGFLIRAGLGIQNPSFWEWGAAKKISLMRNQIKMLEVAAFDRPNISTLLLQDNPISHIHCSFFSRISHLKILDLSYSWITELPPSLSELTQLRVLFLHYCRSLQKIPSLEKLRELRVLTLCGTLITTLPHGMEGLTSLRSLDLSETTKLESIQVGMISSLSHLEELRMWGSGLCKMNLPRVANYLMEMRSLRRLAILTLSIVGYGDHLESIMCLQGQNLKIFSVNVYGSVEDYIEDVEIV